MTSSSTPSLLTEHREGILLDLLAEGSLLDTRLA